MNRRRDYGEAWETYPGRMTQKDVLQAADEQAFQASPEQPALDGTSDALLFFPITYMFCLGPVHCEEKRSTMTPEKRQPLSTTGRETLLDVALSSIRHGLMK